MKKALFVCLLSTFLCPPFFFGQDNLTPGGSETPSQSVQEDNSMKKVVIEISKGRRFTGELQDFDNVEVETNFGKASFSIGEVEGIRFQVDKNNSCVFAFSNGDIVTAKLKLEKVRLKTDWGEANIAPDQIVSIMMNENGSFYSDSSGGKKRWKYSSARQTFNSPMPNNFLGN